MVRILTLWLVALVMVGCSRQMPSIGEVALLGAEYPVGGEWPSRVDVAVDVDNAGGKLKLLRGRLRVSYDGRRVVVLTLERKVVVGGRASEQVILPLKVSVARSSQSLALREALREGNFSDTELEAARRCLIQRYNSACDNADALENFYIGQTIYDDYHTPEQMRAKALEVTREDVQRAARLTHFDSLYMLMPNDEEVAE
jgi:hypothetical protein